MLQKFFNASKKNLKVKNKKRNIIYTKKKKHYEKELNTNYKYAPNY